MATVEIRTCWIFGNKKESEQVFNKIKNKWGDTETYHINEDSSFDDLVAKVGEDDCFSNKRLVKVTSLPDFSGNRQTFVNNIKKLLDNIPINCLVVFYKIDPSEEKAIFSHVEKVGKCFIYPLEVGEIEAKQYAMKTFAEKNIEIEENLSVQIAKNLLSDNKKVNLNKLDLVIDKIELWLGKRKKIDINDINSVVISNNFFTVWDLFELIDNNDYDKCISKYPNVMFWFCDNDYKKFCEDLLNAAYWRFKLLTIIKENLSLSSNKEEAISKILSIKKMETEGKDFYFKFKEGEGFAYNEWQVRKFIQGNFEEPVINKYSRKKLMSIMLYLYQVIEYVRFGVSESEAKMIIDLFFLIGCDKVDDDFRNKMMSIFKV